MQTYKDECLTTLYGTLVGLVSDEHRRQLEKWGVQDRTAFEWPTYAAEELGELAKAIIEHHYRDGTKEDVVKEAIQVATLALKMAEMYLVDNKVGRFCDGCLFLDPTEAEQDEREVKGKHQCTFYKRTVRHGNFHPRTERLGVCLKKDSKRIG